MNAKTDSIVSDLRTAEANGAIPPELALSAALEIERLTANYAALAQSPYVGNIQAVRVPLADVQVCAEHAAVLRRAAASNQPIRSLGNTADLIVGMATTLRRFDQANPQTFRIGNVPAMLGLTQAVAANDQ